jgi:enoyl-CoA hydratase
MILERRREDSIEILTINRPDAGNSLSPELLADLGLALDQINRDDTARAVILTAVGDRIFCGGMDLRAFSEGSGGQAKEVSPEATKAQQAFFAGTYDKPVITAVNGAAVGGGFELVLASDLVVAAEHARFGLPEVKRGLYPAGGGTRLPSRLPLAIALELGLTGDLILAPRALELGLINRVVAMDGLLEAALELAGKVAANGPIAVRVIKQLMRAAAEIGPEHGNPTPETHREVFNSEDAKEGATAFIEKRPPRFTGR